MDNEFLTENDFEVQVRNEILTLLDGSDEKTAVELATRIPTKYANTSAASTIATPSLQPRATTATTSL